MIVYTDGGSRGNPGKAAIGVVVCDDFNQVITTCKEFIGHGTNNEAEYKAIIKGLDLVRDNGGEIRFFSDSQLVVRQLSGVYKVKNTRLKKLFDTVKKLEKNFKSVSYAHVPRSNRYVSMADEMLNQVLDEQ